jgi:hypothetical protein
MAGRYGLLSHNLRIVETKAGARHVHKPDLKTNAGNDMLPQLPGTHFGAKSYHVWQL